MSEKPTGKVGNQQPQKTDILCTALILMEVLMQKNKMFITGNNITRTAKCNYRIAATLYVPYRHGLFKACDCKYHAKM